MSEPWEDFGGGTAVVENDGPWKDFASTEEAPKSQPKASKPKPNTDWMKVGGMGPTPAMGTPLIGSVPVASYSDYGSSEAARQSVIPLLNPEEVPTAEQIKQQFPLVPTPIAAASSAISKGAASIGQIFTSPKGIQEVVTAATPGIGVAQKLKWIYDMASTGGEAAGDLTARIEQAVKNPKAITTNDWQAMAEDAVNTALTMFGAGKLSSSEVGRITGIREPLGRILETDRTRASKDLAAQLEQEVKALPESKIPTEAPTAERRLGFAVQPGEMQQPGMQDLAGAALQEAMRLVKEPGREQEALNALRLAAAPPRVVPVETRTVAEPIQRGTLPTNLESDLGFLPSRGALEQAKAAELSRPLGSTTRESAFGENPPLQPTPIANAVAPITSEVLRQQAAADLDFLAPRGPLESAKRAEVMRKLRGPQETPEQAALRQVAALPKPTPSNPATIPPPKIDLRQLEATMRRNVVPTESKAKGIITGREIETWADEVLRGGATHAGPDVMAAYMVKGVALIERGIINFAEWSAQMIREHGPDIQPYLESLYRAAAETTSRAPIVENSTLKSAREIVEQRLGQAITTPSTPVATTPTPSAQAAPTTTPAPSVKTTLDDVYDIFKPEKKEKFSAPKVASNIVEGIRTGFSSKFRPVNKLSEDIANEYGITKPKDIAGVMEQLKGSSGKGEAQVYRFNRDVASLVKGSEMDFNAFMFLNRSLDRLRQDAKDIEKAMVGDEVKQLNRRQVANYTIPQLESKLALLEQKLGPEKLQVFREAADRYQQYMDESLRLQVESGRMSQDVYNAIKSGNQFYAPFKVLKYLEENSKPEGTGSKIDTVADYTKAMKGIEDPNFKLGDMLAAARGSILVSRILADKANAMRLIADQAAIDKDQKFIKQLGPDEPAPGNWQKVNVFLNGRKVQYAVPPEVAEAVQLFQGNAGGIVSQVLRYVAIPFKAGATALNVPFQVSNLMADVPRQALVSKYGIRGVSDLVTYPLDLVHAIYSSMAGDILGKDNKLFLDFLDSGAAATTIQEYLTPEALKYRDPSTMSKAKRVGMNILNFLPEFSQAIEQTSKILGVKRAMRIEGVKSGAELAKKIPEAITEIRRFSGSPDFGRQGKFVEQARLNLLYMFLNARIQGTIADVGRLTGRDGAKTAATTWFRVGTAIGIPTAYLYYLNNMPEFKKDYDSRPQKEKDNYWIIPKSSFIINDDGEIIRDYWRIPKRESSKWIANMVESGMRFAQQKDVKAFANFGQQMIEDISPINIQGNTGQERIESAASGLNPVLKTPIELATGRDLYRHRQMIPDTMKKASPELQYTDRTAEAFKKLAVIMPDVAPEFLRSPILLENITRNLTAGLLTQFLSRKPIKGREGIENAALMQRFQAIPYTENQAFTKQIRQLDREGADEYLTRQREATKILDDNEGKPLSVMMRDANGNVKLMQKVVDLWVAKQNGATFQDRQVIALPPKQRAEYVVSVLATMTPEQKQQAILEMSRKRILTEQVYVEMSQLPKAATK